MSVTVEGIDLRHRLGEIMTLETPSITAMPSEVLAILGPSGAGKTSLIRLLGLIDRPQRGEVRFDGRKVGPGNLSSRRRIAASMQQPVMWTATVAEEAEYGLAIRGIGRKDRAVRAEQALAEVGLEGFGSRQTSTLSGGEAQRVGLARAIACEPEVLILDEPLAHIDEPLRERLASTLRKFTLRTGCTTIWVTHDRAEALGMSDRMAVLEKGRMMQSGPTMQVFLHPQDEAVARLVGTDNIIKGKIVSSKDGLVEVNVSGGRTAQAVSDLKPGADVYLLVRPEEVLLFIEDPSSPAPRNRFEASVKEVVSQGATAKVHLDAGFDLVALVTRPTVSELSIAPGTKLFAAIKASSFHVVVASNDKG